MRRTLLLSATATILASGAFAAPAAANTAVMGSALTLPYQGGVCNNNCLSVQLTQVGGNSPNPLISPANGVVTSWAVRTGDPDALYTLRILTPFVNNAYVSTTSVSAPAPVPAGTVDSIITYPVTTTVPIKFGQAIGVLQTNGGGAGADVGLPQITTNGVATNVISNNFNGTFLDGLGATFLPDQQHELLLQATIKFCKVPNLVGQKPAAAQAPLTAADCGTATIVRKPVKKKKKRGKILRTNPAADATAAPGTAVKIIVGVKKKKKK